MMLLIMKLTLAPPPRRCRHVYSLDINDPVPLERSPEEMRKALDAADRDV